MYLLARVSVFRFGANCGSLKTSFFSFIIFAVNMLWNTRFFLPHLQSKHMLKSLRLCARKAKELNIKIGLGWGVLNCPKAKSISFETMSIKSISKHKLIC